MRLDKFLADMNLGSRKEVKAYIKKGLVRVNQQIIKQDKYQVDEQNDQVYFDDELVVYQKYFYYLMNKPQGVISATVDDFEETVLDLFSDEDYREDLFPIGRLDKDTEGLLVISNDGALAHRLLSPKKHVPKQYYVEVSGLLTKQDEQACLNQLKIDGGEICLPAQLQILSTDEQTLTSSALLTLHEGKFHQVKRMMQALGKEVAYLKRVQMGQLFLDEQLPLGAYRPLTADELMLLQQTED